MGIDFLVTSFILVIAPGTGVLYTLAYGLSRGAVGSIYAAIGCTFGIVPHLLSAILGLAALLHASAMAFQIAKIAGVAYLLYMAWGALQEKGALSVERKTDSRSGREIMIKGALINILNPKLSMFFLAFLPQFVSGNSEQVAWQMLLLGGIFMAMTLVVFIGYGLFAAALRDHVITRPRIMTWIRRVYAGAFVAMGLKLAMAER
jgi:threonine/homoserine/homoserine lactone efflux protein